MRLITLIFIAFLSWFVCTYTNLIIDHKIPNIDTNPSSHNYVTVKDTPTSHTSRTEKIIPSNRIGINNYIWHLCSRSTNGISN